jgi:hypothetical protein
LGNRHGSGKVMDHERRQTALRAHFSPRRGIARDCSKRRCTEAARLPRNTSRPFGMEDPIETPFLADYVGVVGYKPSWRVLEFLNESSQRVYVPISSKPFKLLLGTLKISLAKRHPNFPGVNGNFSGTNRGHAR